MIVYFDIQFDIKIDFDIQFDIKINSDIKKANAVVNDHLLCGNIKVILW